MAEPTTALWVLLFSLLFQPYGEWYQLPTAICPKVQSYLSQGSALSFEISLNLYHTFANCLSINLS